MASGCAHEDIEDGSVPNPSPDKGILVKEFSISDEELGPNQRGIITLRLENYHGEGVEINDLSLYNTAFLEVGEKKCVPDKIKDFRAGKPGRKECTWTVEVPDSSVEGFRDKIVPIKLNLNYSSELNNNRNPLKMTYKPVQQIEETEDFSKTYTNNELELRVDSERPVPSEGRLLEMELANVGPGRVDGALNLDYEPSSLFDCSEKEELIGQTASFTCRTSYETGGRTTRNLIFSISYKYVKAPTLDIRVVEQ